MSAEPQRNRWKTPALIAIIASAIWWSVAGQCSLRRAVLLVANLLGHLAKEIDGEDHLAAQIADRDRPHGSPTFFRPATNPEAKLGLLRDIAAQRGTSVRTVQRAWEKARLILFEGLNESP